MKVFERIDAAIPLNGDERMLLDSLRNVCRDTVAAQAAEHDRTGTFPWASVKALNALGMNAMFEFHHLSGLRQPHPRRNSLTQTAASVDQFLAFRLVLLISHV